MFCSLKLLYTKNHHFVRLPNFCIGNLAITDLCVGIVLDPVVVIYIGFPFPKKNWIFNLVSVISGIVRLSEQAMVMVMNGGWYLKEKYPVTAHSPNFGFWTGCREIKRREESRRTMKNRCASRLVEFDTILKLLRITDQ